MGTSTTLLNTANFTGRVEWIGIARISGGAVEPQATVELVENGGIVGEHHYRRNSRSKRQVTLIQREHMDVVAALLKRESIAPEALRRNIVVSGINLATLRDRSFSIGGAVLTGTGDCPPCARMEQNLGAGGYAAMVGHGGITCVVAENGVITTGDSVRAMNGADV
ncbi:MAG: MOSC domain-containing protein [Fuerstiella sp.]